MVIKEIGISMTLYVHKIHKSKECHIAFRHQTYSILLATWITEILWVGCESKYNF